MGKGREREKEARLLKITLFFFHRDSLEIGATTIFGFMY